MFRKPQVPDARLNVSGTGGMSLSLALTLLWVVGVTAAIQCLVGLALLTISVPEHPGRRRRGAR